MIVLESLASIVFLAWGIFSFWVIFQILKLVWPVLKEDWFWFATKSGYYKGMFLGAMWFFAAMAPCAWLGQAWMLIPFTIQVGIAIRRSRSKKLPKLDILVWFGMPFFVTPLWLSVRQGQKLGEVPSAA